MPLASGNTVVLVCFMVSAVRPEAQETKMVCLPFPTVKFKEDFYERFSV